MSKKLAALTLTLAVLVCSMGLKTAMSANHAKGAVLVANGPDPIPPKRPTQKP